jgi:hypothetical protein
MAIALVASSALVEVSRAAGASGGSPVWTASFSGGAAIIPTTTPAGNVIANANPLEELTPAGAQVWQVPATASPQPIAGVATTTDVNGNTYVPVQDNNGRYLESLDKTGASRWTTAPLFTYACCEMALGWDGHVYITGRPNPSTTHILGFDEATGAQTLDIVTGDVTNLFAYPGGLIQVAGNTVSYYSYQGQPIGSVSGGAPLSSYVGYSSASGGNGLVFNAGHSSFSQFSCSAPSVEAITPAGIKWTWTAPDNFGCGTFLTATPDGGVILTTQSGSAAASISSTGTTRWTYTPTAPHSAVAELYPAIVDVNGNVALPFSYQYSTPNSLVAVGTEIDFVTQGSSSIANPSLVLEEGTCDRSRMASYSSVDVGANQLYVALVIDCPDQTVQTIQAYGEPGFGTNYRLSANTPDYNPPPYVGLGDSYSSGEGLGAYQTTPVNTDSATDRCHRSAHSYEQLVLPTSTSRTFRACSSAVVNDFYNRNHAYPSEPAQLGWLKSSTRRVTLTVGGDDVGFGTVLKSCAYVQTFLLTKSVWRQQLNAADCNKRLQGAAATIAALKPRLEQLYTSILAKTPSTAEIRVLTYPSIFPSSFTGLANGLWCLAGYGTSLGLTVRAEYAEANVEAIRQGELLLNNTIRSAVAAVVSKTGQHRLIVASIDQKLAGHTISCGDKGRPTPYVNGFVVAWGKFITSAINAATGQPGPSWKQVFLSLVSTATFHPTAGGQSAMAVAVDASW